MRALLDRVSLDKVFDPRSWPGYTFYAKVIPSGDILPVRAQYGDEDPAHSIGLNHLTADDALWYAGPDLIGSTLLTGRAPRILEAFRLVPVGKAPGLRPVKIRGRVIVDPTREDFFRVVIEQRRRIQRDPGIADAERERLDKLLKVLANSGSYGIFAEINRRETTKAVDLNVYAHDDDRRIVPCKRPEEPGRFCFPPVAALITAAARLMLALLEKTVTDAGGSYAFCDTDSMGIVAARDAHLVACENGSLRLPNGRPAIQALSWRQVDANDRNAISGSILKIEKYNREGNKDDGAFREIECHAISAKRYALFVCESNGSPRVIHRSEHGLGALMNPNDPEGGDTADTTEECEGLRWITDAWRAVTCHALGVPVDLPDWFDLPAVSRLTTSKPSLLAPFAKRNDGRSYAGQVKPFNFVLSAHVAPQGHPEGVNPSQFHLMAPYETEARKLTQMKWTDRHTGQRFRIYTGIGSGFASRERARVLSYADFLDRYELHAESKSAAPDGSPCGRDTYGLLNRRQVTVQSVALIGKESNSYDEVEAGAHQDWDDVLNVYSARTCTCGNPITDKRASYCSSRCRQAAHRVRKRHG
ncbi:MAG TPA: hypothetical protein VK679_00735 [Gemmatimonadaceae bacterium]|nr:hypothetical protein [Gemmatimonadaceae bacterium]